MPKIIYSLDFCKNIAKSFLQYISVQIKDEINSRCLRFHLSKNDFNKIFLKNNIENKENVEKKEKGKNEFFISKDLSNEINFFDRENFYKMFLEEFKKINTAIFEVEFNSFYSLLFFIKTINYIEIIIDSNENIVENPKFKVFLYLLLIFFQGDKDFQKNLGINEAFFIGTFEELKKEYFK